ncbi:MAG: beta-hydroxyacyl-ACP dehydratase [Bacteroidales bacterium]|nr:beta-hydroxyacyl-ACP dehydratase [Bacteroidales bacterium]
MILQNELYTIVETGDNVARIRLLPECAIYQGHFPGNPVTPGVCQVGIVEELAGGICGFRLRLKEVKLLKYMDILRPSTDDVEVNFDKLEEEGDVVVAKGFWVSGGRVFTKFSLVFGKEA